MSSKALQEGERLADLQYKKYKILFLVNLFHPHVGGVEKHVLNVSKILKKTSDISVLTRKFSSDQSRFEKYKNISIYRFSSPEVKYIGLLVIWLQLFRNIGLFLRHDIVHVHDVFIWYLPINFVKKSYLTFHGWEGSYPIPQMSKLQKKLAEKLTLGNIAVGYYILKYYKIKADYIVYGASDIRNGELVKDKDLIVYLGRLSSDTSIEVFLESLEIIKSKYNVLFCGDGELRSKCEEFGEVLGFVNPSKYLKKASIVFAAGYLSVIESLACECYVLTGYKNKISKDIYKKSPFADWIEITNQPKILAGYINRFHTSRKSLHKSKILPGSVWARSQSWTSVTKTYEKLWKVK